MKGYPPAERRSAPAGTGRHRGPGTHEPLVEVDRERRAFAVQGGWWYRGVHTLEPHERGTMVVHRVYNVARVGRWMVPLVLLHYRLTGRLSAGTLGDSLRDLLRHLGEQLGCRAYLLPS